MTKKSIIIILIICSSIINIFGQKQETKVVKDLELWTSAGISKKLNKHWKISFDQEVRLTNEMSEFDTWFTDLGVDYKLNKHFRLGTNYRFYQIKEDDNQFKTKHRISADIKFKQKIDRFTIEYRLRGQNKDEDFLESTTNDNIFNIRNRISLSYNINHWKADPFFDAELYRRMYTLQDGKFSKLRWTMGVEFPLYKNSEVKLFYRIDNELNTNYPKDTFIIGLGYKYSF
jgi:opacity protein-like surface antigen